jgi:flavorubredoxin
MLIDGKVYLGDEDGDVVIMQEGKTKKVLAEINMGSSVYSTPVPAHGALFLKHPATIATSFTRYVTTKAQSSFRIFSREAWRLLEPNYERVLNQPDNLERAVRCSWARSTLELRLRIRCSARRMPARTR